jgi:hypothetical protein
MKAHSFHFSSSWLKTSSLKDSISQSDLGSFCQQQCLLSITQNILHLHRSQDMLHVQRWTWMHKDVKPWGKILPAQCLGCRAIHTLEAHRKEKKAYAFECQSCHYMAYFEPEPNNLVTGPTLSGGCWMRKDVR